MSRAATALRRALSATPRRWGVFVVGVLVLLPGVALTIAAGAEVAIGAGSWQALETGLASATGASIGTVILVESLAALALAWALFRVPPGPGTVLIALVGGPVIGLLLRVLPTPSTVLPATVLLVAGGALIGLGVGLYVASDIGASAQDMLFVGLFSRLPIRPGVARLALDATLVLLALPLGGQVGPGTLLLLLVLPVVVERSLPLGHRLAGTSPDDLLTVAPTRPVTEVAG
jgi:hypothetical protein